MTGVSSLSVNLTIILIILLLHSRPGYLSVRFLEVVLDIDNFLLFLYSMLFSCCEEYMQIFESKFIILIILYLLLTVIGPPVFSFG